MGYTGTHERYVNFYTDFAFSPDERKDYRESQKDFWDMCAVTETAEKKGREEGMEEGMKKGRAEGLEEGMAKGRAEEKLQIARNMKLAGMTIEMIAQVTGLSADEIDKA